jgi:hypothetical protein
MDFKKQAIKDGLRKRFIGVSGNDFDITIQNVGNFDKFGHGKGIPVEFRTHGLGLYA